MIFHDICSLLAAGCIGKIKLETKINTIDMLWQVSGHFKHTKAAKPSSGCGIVFVCIVQHSIFFVLYIYEQSVRDCLCESQKKQNTAKKMHNKGKIQLRTIVILAMK